MIDFEALSRVREDISALGREVVVVAASKTQNSDTIDSLMKAAPDIILGENRVQELLAKYNPKYRWHFIGRLQTNKVKYIIDKVELIHSLDREELAREIEKQAAKRGKVQECLVEVNMGSEESKGGVLPNMAIPFLKSLAGYEHIRVCGLMSVMPKADERTLETLYKQLASLYEEAKTLDLPNSDIKYLSAGMSRDYKIALACGANVIRLGSLIFGERNAQPNK